MRGRVATLCLVLLAAGCASPSSRFYTLTASAPSAAAPAWDKTVSVGPVVVPASVDRLEIVVTVGPGYDALAAAHSRAVARLSADIAAAIKALDGAAGK